MKTLCPDCGDPKFTCCDHCKHYSFNPDECGRYVGAGWCNLHKVEMDPGDDCDDFYCSALEK